MKVTRGENNSFLIIFSCSRQLNVHWLICGIFLSVHRNENHEFPPINHQQSRHSSNLPFASTIRKNINTGVIERNTRKACVNQPKWPLNSEEFQVCSLPFSLVGLNFSGANQTQTNFPSQAVSSDSFSLLLASLKT